MRKRKARFVEVSRDDPCLACGNHDWCTIECDDAGYAVRYRCRRLTGGEVRLDKNGNPYAVVDTERNSLDLKPIKRVEREYQQPSRKPPEQWHQIAMRCYQHHEAKATREQLSRHLGVSSGSLAKLMVGFAYTSKGRRVSTWPCRDGDNNIIGISVRFRSGSKFMWRGSDCGLFYCEETIANSSLAYLVEGGSDTAACITRLLPAVGRFNNVGPIKHLKRLVERIGIKFMVVAERDDKETCTAREKCTGCLQCRPGYHGALFVAESINADVIFPPGEAKDMRQALMEL